MNRFFLALGAAVFALSIAAFITLPSAHAQPPICLNLEPGTHDLVVPSQEREGNVIFQVEIGEGGVVTEFYEPGGQPIGAAAGMGIFASGDYELPEGVAVVECAGAGGDTMQEDGGSMDVCLNLEPGAHTDTVSAGGRTYDITINVGDNNQIINVELLGDSYTAQEALGLLRGFGAALPAGIQIVPCAGAQIADGYGNAGSGGLADSSDLTAVWAAVAAVAIAAVAGASITAARRRGASIRIRERD